MYSGKTADGKTLTFGTSGLLYRSNKLMFDRQTHSLWSNLTGEPVVGPLAQSELKLKILPATLTTWMEWKSTHPNTTVLKLMPEVGERWGFRYVPGAADHARAGVSFPVWLKNENLKPKEEVYAIRIGDAAKAYSISVVLQERVVNDQVGDVPVVLLGDPDSGAIRAYRRDKHRFTLPDSGLGVRDENGQTWTREEEALIRLDSRLERVPGFVTLWFAWYGFFPQTQIYHGSQK